jgi:TPR repeat protein
VESASKLEQGTPPDLPAAAKLFVKAAAQGHVEAQRMLLRCASLVAGAAT